MEEEIEVIAFACRGTLLDWAGAVEAVAYELARRNGESPLDRGVALRRRVEALADGHGLARGFERLARERGYTARRAATSRSPASSQWRARCGAPASWWRAPRAPGRGRSPSRAARAPARCTSSARPSRPCSATSTPTAGRGARARAVCQRGGWRREEARSPGLRAVAPAQLDAALVRALRRILAA